MRNPVTAWSEAADEAAYTAQVVRACALAATATFVVAVLYLVLTMEGDS